MSVITTSLPTSGSFPVKISSLINEGGSNKKRKSNTDEYVALRYAFKPASITQATPGILDSGDAKSRSITFDVNSGSQQVFEVKEEISKPRECILIWDEDTRTFTLHPLSTTLSLTLNRSASTSSRRPAAGAPSKPPSIASSSSSSSIPLAKRKTTDNKQDGSPSSGEQRHEVSSLVGETDETPKAKKVKPSEVIAPVRPMKGGKSIPRKTIPPRAPAVKSTPGKGTGGSKKRATKAPPTPKGKLSAETIEDSDEDYGLNDGGEGDEAEDEFAKMVGESLAADEGEDGDEAEEDEDEDEEDDEGDELGGARLVVRDEGRSASGRIDDTSEWL